jgi:hypothetical protein
MTFIMGLMVIREVLLERGAAGLAVQPVRLRDRVRARVRATALDRQLAAGATPEASVALALHAARVYGQTQRRLLARSLTRIAEASEPASARVGVPVDRVAVERARDELEAVADRLNADGPVSVRGVALIRLLLADGSGPLYRTAPPELLRRELCSTLEALDLAS